MKKIAIDEIRLAGIDHQSLVNGPGLRKVFFSQGCKHHCFNCFNKETWPFTGGKVFKIKELLNDFSKESKYLDGVTLSGGDPIEQAEKFAILAKEIKKFKLNIWLYTGYKWEELLQKMKTDKNIEELLKNVDVVVDGKFVDKLKSTKHIYRGSSNQRLIDVKKTLKNKKIFEYILLKKGGKKDV